jgi:hypothetical protein
MFSLACLITSGLLKTQTSAVRQVWVVYIVPLAIKASLPLPAPLRPLETGEKRKNLRKIVD